MRDRDKAIKKWTRQGECDHCEGRVPGGWCCEFLGKTKVGAFVYDQGDEEYMKVRGFTKLTYDGKEGWYLAGFVHAPCPMHIDNRCSIYDKRPGTCKLWPWAPEQVVGTPCAYYFESEEGDKIGGDGSPYPGVEENN